MNSLNEYKTTYFVYCVNHFADRYKLSANDAFNYLFKYGGMNFLDEFYQVEHLLSLNDAVEDLTAICKNNGGNLS